MNIIQEFINSSGFPDDIFKWVRTVEFVGILKTQKAKFKTWLLNIVNNSTSKIILEFESPGYLKIKSFKNNKPNYYSISLNKIFEYFRFYPTHLKYKITIEGLHRIIKNIDTMDTDDVIICMENNRLHNYSITNINNYEREIYPEYHYIDEYDDSQWYINSLDIILTYWDREDIREKYIKRIE